jgi:hypothetical protein
MEIKIRIVHDFVQFIGKHLNKYLLGYWFMAMIPSAMVRL